jgi:hypothetical protein
MNKDLAIFSKVINHLVYLTTRDEYGSSRSRGIETLSDLADELNMVGIYASKGMWNENSLKIHLSRVKHRYPAEVLMSECDIELIDRCAWEYTSGTPHEQIVHKKKCGRKWIDQKITKSYPLISYQLSDGEVWKENELNEIISEEIKIMKKVKKMKHLDT